MPEPIFILAPMDDVTDTVFRRIVTDLAAPDFTMTEFVNVDGLCSPGRARLMPRLSAELDNNPVIAQIWGKTPENFETIAREIADGTIPGFCGIDLNFGCPDKSVVKNECCSALAQPHLQAKAIEIIQSTKRGAGKMPLSIKTRLGFKDIDYGWHELLLREQPSMLTVHVRTTKQMSKVPAQWEAILPIVELRDKLSPDTKIILNGDIANRQQGEELAVKYGVDGIMIGRGIFQNPLAFSRDKSWNDVTAQERIELLKKHIALWQQAWPNGERKFDPLKKFCKVYISDFDGAKELREKIMRTTSAEELLTLI